MSYIINDPGCDLSYQNTGLPTCPIDLGLIDGGFICDPSFKLTPAEVLDLKASLQDAAVAAGKNRIFPLPSFEEMTDQSEEPVEETLGYGAKQILRDGKQIRMFRFLKGGLCVLKNLRSFNTKEVGIMYYAIGTDGTRQVIGSVDSDGNLCPFTLNQFYTYPVKLADGKTGNQYRLKISEQDPSEWDSYAVVKVDFDPKAEVKGVLDLELSKDITYADTVTVFVKTKCDQINVYDDLADLLADADAWVCTKKSDGSVATITAVTKEAGSKTLLVHVNGVTGDYYLTITSAAALAALGIGGGNSNGYEAYNTLTVTFTAGS